MSATNRAAVRQPGKAAVNRMAQFGVAGKVHIHAGLVSGDLVKLLVSQHPAVAAQVFAKRCVGCGSEAHNFNAGTLRQLKRGAVGRLARRAGQQQGGRPEKIVVGQKIID